MIITPTTIRNLQTGFKAAFQAGYDSSPAFWNMLATEIPSSDRSETYGWMAKLPKMREWLGERVVQTLALHSYTLVNKTFESTVGVTREEIEDDRLGVFSPIMRDLGGQAAKQPDFLLADLIQAGNTSLGFDGQFFFDTDHPTSYYGQVAGVQSNHFTGTALSHANYGVVRAAMMGFKGDDGKPLGVMPNILLVPPQLEKTGLEILQAQMISNNTNVYQGSAMLKVVPELASEGDAWYLLDTSRAIRPFIFQNRRGAAFTALDQPTDANVFNNNTYIYGADMRCNVGYALWFLASRGKA